MRVRSLWEKYYADAHGLIFVIDSADVGRFEEARMAFGEWLLKATSFRFCKYLLVLIFLPDFDSLSFYRTDL